MTKPRDWYKQNEAAKLFGVTLDTFRRYCIDHEITGEKVGRVMRYELPVLLELKGRIENKRGYRRGLAEKPEQHLDATELLIEKERAELLLTQERAETQRLKNAETNRQLARVDLLTYALGKMCAQVVATLDALPGKLKRSLPALTASEIEIARREVATCLNAVSETEIDFDDYEGDGTDD